VGRAAYSINLGRLEILLPLESTREGKLRE